MEHGVDEMSKAEKIALLLKEKAKVFIGAGLALIAFFLVLGFLEYGRDKKNNASILAAEDMEKVYGDYLKADEDKKADKQSELQVLIDEALAEYEGFYAQMRALDIQALLYKNEKEYEKAAEAWITLSEAFPESYMAPVALVNAAACREDGGDLEGAISLYTLVEENYKDRSADRSEVLFNLGRLNEKKGDTKQALSWYEQIDGPALWLNLAKSRIIAINAGA